MSDYLLINTSGPFDADGGRRTYRLAAHLAGVSNNVTIFLVQNGVFAARMGAETSGLTDAQHAGVRILADAFSLKERAIFEEEMPNGIRSAPLETVIDAMAAGVKTIWR